jgi:ketosteroid isomerase-like protein
MKTLLRLSLLAILAFAIAACQPPANTNTISNTNTNAAPKAAAPTAEALLDMDKKAWEAWTKKDVKFFETYLADSYVGFDDKGRRTDRATELKMIAEHKCDMKSYSLSEPRMTTVTPDVAVVTYKATLDGTCEGQKVPANSMVATAMVRSGDTWKGVYHNEVAIMEPKTAPADNSNKSMPAPPSPAKDEKPATNTNAASNMTATSNSNTASSDTLTDAVMAVEKRGWEGWMKKDAKTLEEVTGKEVAFVDTMGSATFGQAAVIKHWTTDNPCTVTSVNVTDGKATNITKDVAILTYKGTAVGTCGDTKLMPLWGTTIAVNEGGSWKAVYIFETPAS